MISTTLFRGPEPAGNPLTSAILSHHTFPSMLCRHGSRRSASLPKAPLCKNTSLMMNYGGRKMPQMRELQQWFPEWPVASAVPILRRRAGHFSMIREDSRAGGGGRGCAGGPPGARSAGPCRRSPGEEPGLTVRGQPILQQIASAISWVPTAVGSSRSGFMSWVKSFPRRSRRHRLFEPVGSLSLFQVTEHEHCREDQGGQFPVRPLYLAPEPCVASNRQRWDRHSAGAPRPPTSAPAGRWGCRRKGLAGRYVIDSGFWASLHAHVVDDPVLELDVGELLGH